MTMRLILSVCATALALYLLPLGVFHACFAHGLVRRMSALHLRVDAVRSAMRDRDVDMARDLAELIELDVDEVRSQLAGSTPPSAALIAGVSHHLAMPLDSFLDVAP